MNTEGGNNQWYRLFVIINDIIGVDICGSIDVPDFITNSSVTNADDGGTGVNEYPNKYNEDFRLI